MPGIRARTARPHDTAEIRRLAVLFTPAAAQVPLPAFEARLEEMLRVDNYCLAVAEVRGRVVGYALAQDFGPGLRSTFTTGRMHDLYVEETARRSGAGRALVEWVCAWVRARPQPMVLDWQASAGGVAFYEALGFAPDYVGDYAEFPGFCLDLRGT